MIKNPVLAAVGVADETRTYSPALGTLAVVAACEADVEAGVPWQHEIGERQHQASGVRVDLLPWQERYLRPRRLNAGNLGRVVLLRPGGRRIGSKHDERREGKELSQSPCGTGEGGPRHRVSPAGAGIRLDVRH